jgi:hypothetical protein
VTEVEVNPLLDDADGPTRGDLYLARHDKKIAKQRDRRAKARQAALAADMAEAGYGPAQSQEAERRELRIDGPTLEAFLDDFNFVTIIRGPWASGKSVASIAKMFQISHLQGPNRQGVRKTRWAVIRNSYPDLQETTIKSWLWVFPEEVYGPLRRSRPFQHVIKAPGDPWQGRATTVEMEVIFIALDDDEDRKKLLSMELTGIWVNEAREVKKSIIDDAIGRTGRYPSKTDGGHSWSGAIMDTNAPAETHWLPMMMGESPIPDTLSDDEKAALVRPADWTYYVQPGALRPVKDGQGKILDFEPNPDAENINNLTDGYGYYLRRKGGKTNTWVLINFCNELGVLMAGKPVWPTFERTKHVAAGPIAFDPSLELLVAIDSTGRNPAAVFGQVQRGRPRILSELIGRDVAVPVFAPQVKNRVARIAAAAGLNTAQLRVRFYRDPHQEKGQSDDSNTDQMYAKAGIRLMPAPGGNLIATRTQTVEVLFDRGHIEIDPSCTTLIAACSGGYRYRKLKIAGVDAYDETPDKQNGYADVADALQYLCLGAGLGMEMVRGSEKPKPVNVARAINPMERGKKAPQQQGRASLFARR